jgi:hypothetical protein
VLKFASILAVAKLVYAALGLVVLVVEDIMDGQPGAQKKEAAIARIPYRLGGESVQRRWHLS